MQHHMILGGGGFIGGHVARRLASAGHRVTVADRAPYAHRDEVDDPIASIVLELGTADWDRLLEDVDVVHHYVWTSTPASANADPGRDLAINVGTTITLLDALRRRGRGRIIFSSSGGTVYGRIRQNPVPEDHPIAPITAYGASKATAELYFGLYRDLHGVDCRIARIANPYGPGQKLISGVGAITAFIHHAIRREPIVIWGDGTVVRDYVYIEDVAACLEKLATADILESHIFNIGSGIGTSLNTIVAEIETHYGYGLNVQRTERRSFDVPVNVLDTSRVQKELGWLPSTSLGDGVRLTLQHLADHRSALA